MQNNHGTWRIVAGVLPLLAVIAGCATKPAAPTLAPNQFRMETASRIEHNGKQGGTLRLTLPQEQTATTLYKLRHGSSDVGGMLAPPSTEGTDGLAVKIVPTWKNGDVETTVAAETITSVLIEQAESSSPESPAKHSVTYTMKSGAAMDFGRKPFVWAAKDGVYPFGKPVTLGTVDSKPVTLTIGKP